MRKRELIISGDGLPQRFARIIVGAVAQSVCAPVIPKDGLVWRMMRHGTQLWQDAPGGEQCADQRKENCRDGNAWSPQRPGQFSPSRCPGLAAFRRYRFSLRQVLSVQ